MHVRRIVVAAGLAIGLTLVGATPTVAADSPQQVTVAEVKDALADQPGLLANSDKVIVRSDIDSAAVSTVAGTTIDVPRAPGGQIVVTNPDGTKLSIDLPNVSSSGQARTVAPGVVAYPAANGAADAVQLDEHGGVRSMKIIDSPAAPVRFPYDFNPPAGTSFVVNAEGGIEMRDESGGTVGMIGSPVAYDANNRPVPTRFELDPETGKVTQVVAHRTSEVAYPVTADPFLIPAVIVRKIIRCGAGGYLGWISSGGWHWWSRAVAVADGCLRGI